MTRRRPQRSLARRLVAAVVRKLVASVLIVATLSVLWVAAYRVLDPPGGIYALSERLRLGEIAQRWVALEDMSQAIPRAVIAAEDARFCAHWGVDVEAIGNAVRANLRGTGRFGASTLTQQVAKNVFLWHGRTWWRKGLEAWFTGLIEILWTKRRIVEVYLNVAEFGEGVFGVGAAADVILQVPVGAVSRRDAARLAVVLPNPKARDPGALSPRLQQRAADVAAGAQILLSSGRDACVRIP